MKQLISNLQGTAVNLIKTGREIYNTLQSKEYEGNADLLLQKKIDLIVPIAENMQRNIAQDPSLVQLPVNLQESIDSVGSDIWNLGCQLNVNKETLHGVKYFAIVLIIIYDSFNPSVERSFSILECLIRLLSSSINATILGVAKKCQNFAETFLNKLLTIDKECDLSKSDKSLIADHNSKFLLLSLSYEVVSGNFDTAKIYEAKLIDFNSDIPFDFVLETSRILYNSALDLFEKGNYEVAHSLASMSIKFMEKAITEESQDTIKTRYLQTYILLIKCYKRIGREDSMERAISAVKLMQNQFPNKFEVYRLYFEVADLTATNCIDEVMMRMVMSISMEHDIENVLNLLKQNVQYSFRGVNNCLDYLLTNLHSNNQKQAGLLVITKFVVNTDLAQQEEPQLRIKELELFIELAERTLHGPLDLNIKMSTLALLWKQGMIAYKAFDYDQSSQWLKLSLTRLLHMPHSESQDRGKIVRAIENNQILLGNGRAVLDLHKELDPEDEESMLSQYNLFRASVLLKDETSAAMQFAKIVETNANANTVLAIAACIIESTDNLSNEFIKNAFFKLLNILCSKQFNEDFVQNLSSFGIILPVCCRCAILMFSNDIEKDEVQVVESDLQNLCEILHESCSFASRFAHSGGHIFNTNDHEWCASKAYNIAILCKQIDRSEIGIRLCQICIRFISLISSDIETAKYSKIIAWKARAWILTFLFLCKKDDLGVDDWNYIKKYSDAMLEEIAKGEMQDDQFQCAKQLSTFRFQAELVVGSTEQVQVMAQDCSRLKPKTAMELYDVYVNLLIYSKRTLVKHAKSSILLSIITCALSIAEASYLSKLVTWVRFFLECSNDEFDAEKEKMVFQFYRLYQSNVTVAAVPSFEIEWLASVSWNLGVKKIIDYKELNRGLKWCAIAMLLSKFVHERMRKQKQGHDLHG
ncbi:SPO22 [Candida theae]|uniref:SPO22 n=1 Tax=Candida theae TaxID=1198502 RepID=A0AAD5BED7_9ASCO|nr:SPO22 [Candida theae]KAI5958102.1 SPO22 [Candida theae]